jgi:acetolactate synthase-1/2/3 large subunit
MTIQELATAKEENIKVIAVIMNNAYLGMVRQWAELFFDRRYSGVYLKRNPDFAKVANAYGLDGYTVTQPNELASTLEEAYRSDEAVVVDVHVQEEANILPMSLPGGNPATMFGGCCDMEGML